MKNYAFISIVFLFGLIIVLFAYQYSWEKSYAQLNNKYIKLNDKYDRLNQTFQLYYLKEYEKNYTSYGALAVAYCWKDILLIDIKGREYYEALESFNHEWLHCRREGHFPDRVIIGGKE